MLQLLLLLNVDIASAYSHYCPWYAAQTLAFVYQTNDNHRTRPRKDAGLY